LQLIEVLHTIASKIASGLFQADNNFEAQKRKGHRGTRYYDGAEFEQARQAEK